MPTFSFRRQERLKSRTLIGKLFQEGNTVMAYPFRVVWFPLDYLPSTVPGSDIRAQVAFTVPKRVFKTAVARNLIKRRMREAYRLHKHALYQKLAPDNQHIVLMLMYVAKEELPFAEMERGMHKLLHKLFQPAPPK